MKIKKPTLKKPIAKKPMAKKILTKRELGGPSPSGAELKAKGQAMKAEGQKLKAKGQEMYNGSLQQHVDFGKGIYDMGKKIKAEREKARRTSVGGSTSR